MPRSYPELTTKAITMRISLCYLLVGQRILKPHLLMYPKGNAKLPDAWTAHITYGGPATGVVGLAGSRSK